MTIPVTVVGGYLGAGKTTFVNHVLRHSGERVAVIVNDFGEISIDEDLIVAAEGDKLTLANGCICCTLADGFAAALLTVRSTDPAPQRLLIEASGVADPAQIAAYGHTPGLRLDGVVVLADAEQVRRQAADRWVGDTVRLQLAAADVVVANKVDLLRDGETGAEADELWEWLGSVADGASVVRAERAAVPMDVLFGSRGASQAQPGAARGVAESSAADVFDTQTVELTEPISLDLVRALLDALPESVVRLKGIVACLDGETVAEYEVQAVGSRSSVTPAAPIAAGQSARRWALSLISRKGALPPNWLSDQLLLTS